MTQAGAIFLSLLLFSAAMSIGAVVLSSRVLPDSSGGKRPLLGLLVRWGGTGLLGPIFLWALLNLGISEGLQPFMPEVQYAQASGRPWFPAWLKVFSYGLFVISSFWACITLTWAAFLSTAHLDAEAKRSFRGLCITCAIGMSLPAGLILFLGGPTSAGLAALAILVPLVGYTPGIAKPKKLPPIYARAIARMKFGKYDEAEWEIIRELEKSEDDFEGWMMLADLYATKFQDVAQAELTIRDICDHPKTTPSQVSIALHKLADWHLKISADPAAAIHALQQICARLPGTHLGRMAKLRIDQTPRTREQLAAQSSPQAVPLPALTEDGPPPPPIERHVAARMANECVEALRADPNDTPAREKLARLFAEHLGKPEQGIDQLKLLLGMPGQDETRRAEWLALNAAWHLRLLNDPDTAQSLLNQLIAQFPASPQAFMAKRRLLLMQRARQQLPS